MPEDVESAYREMPRTTRANGMPRSGPKARVATPSRTPVSDPGGIRCMLKSAGMSTPKFKLFNRTFWQSLIAVLVGNAIYYGIYRYLPPRGQHQLYRIDWGMAGDFWICVICYELVRMIP